MKALCFVLTRPGLATGQIGQMPDGPDARWAGRRSDSIDRPLIFLLFKKNKEERNFRGYFQAR
jgi:hypothetical protein